MIAPSTGRLRGFASVRYLPDGHDKKANIVLTRSAFLPAVAMMVGVTFAGWAGKFLSTSADARYLEKPVVAIVGHAGRDRGGWAILSSEALRAPLGLGRPQQRKVTLPPLYLLPQMTDESLMDQERERLAEALAVEKRYGDHAPRFIAERIGSLALSGDWEGVARWKEIAAMFDALRRTSGRPN